MPKKRPVRASANPNAPPDAESIPTLTDQIPTHPVQENIIAAIIAPWRAFLANRSDRFMVF